MPTAMATTAIVLAAGRGERVGGPKALLVVGDRPLVALHVQRAHEAGAREVVVVVRPELVARVDALLGGEAIVASSEAPDPFGSLRVGLAASTGAAGTVVVVSPIDALPAAASTWRGLLDAIASGATAAVPTYRGRGGHPVALRRTALSLDRATTLREVLVNAAATRVSTDDASVITDLDTPDDVMRATGAPPSFAT